MTPDPLQDALRAIAADDRRLSASPEVEARVLAAVKSVGKVRRLRSRAAMLAAAAVLFIAVAVPFWSQPDRDPIDREPLAADAGSGEMVTEFFPLTYSTVPAPGGQIVRMQVPRSALVRFGVSSFDAAGDRSPTVMAEVVVGNDGLARAVRFVRAAAINELEEQKQ
jgi:hypothetical protein